ncbi:hypothetical protein HanRHA438_Chr13g0577771 [Helianthus annuus]|nr:hypothetical protein HanIR_Chr13g0616651 [Helianthus annuus]KAJ0856372.1 hypothetical protein HanRHA438_Chr13g0577771 [Helianthus annuus]
MYVRHCKINFIIFFIRIDCFYRTKATRYKTVARSAKHKNVGFLSYSRRKLIIYIFIYPIHIS